MESIKVLHYIPGFEFGGIESRLLDWYKELSQKNIQFDVLKLTKGDNNLTDQIKMLGGNVYELPEFSLKNLHAFNIEIKKFFNEHNDYDIVHVHNLNTGYFILKEAKKHKIKTRIIHSRTTNYASGEKGIPIKKILKRSALKYATDYFACSEEAGLWAFGGVIKKSPTFRVIKNGINLPDFEYDKKIRDTYRKKMNLEKNIVIGNIGRFSPQKNHKFLISIFNELYKDNDKYKLLLVGEGILKDEILEQIRKLNLEKQVLLVGKKEDVNPYLQCMDLFLFPSNYEGFGTVLLEAQATGLQCVASDVVPKLVGVTPLLKFVSLSKDAKYWSQVVKESLKDIERKDFTKEIKQAGFSVETTTEYLEKKYLNIN